MVAWFPGILEFVPGYLGGVLWYLGLVPNLGSLVAKVRVVWDPNSQEEEAPRQTK